jgi:uncharacterized circularly permuted ATP-grasp superfamily protein
MIKEAIDRYHNLLTPAVATEAYEQLQFMQRERGLYFGDRPLCRVLRPHFYEREKWDYLRRETGLVLKAFARIHAAARERADVREQLSLEPYEEELFHLDDHIDVPWTTSRLDAFFSVEDYLLSFVEYNAETPAGIGYGDVLADAFMQLEPMKQFQQHYHVEYSPGLGQLQDALLKGFAQWGGREEPRIAIVDWADVPTRSEHEITRQYFARQGIQSVLADPREMEYRDGALWVKDFKVNLIYKRVLVSELMQRMGIDNPLVQAVRERTVLMTNSLSAKLLAKKASLAVLSDERNAWLFDADQQRAIAEHIPWTRRVEDHKTLFHGQEIDLLPFIRENRNRMVLKPNDEYGGKGVLMGWHTTDEEWDATLRTALTTPYVVQESVKVVYRDFPAILPDGSLDISARFVDADPYVFYGETVGGCLTRLSSEALLNVTAGGGSVVPMFVLEEKN